MEVRDGSHFSLLNGLRLRRRASLLLLKITLVFAVTSLTSCPLFQVLESSPSFLLLLFTEAFFSLSSAPIDYSALARSSHSISKSPVDVVPRPPLPSASLLVSILHAKHKMYE